MLVFHHQFHVHVVVTATTFHGAFNQVLSLLLRSDERIVLSPFSQADVPALIAEFLHHEAVHRPVSRLLTPEVGLDPQHDLFSGLVCDDRFRFTWHFERIVFVGDHYNHTPPGGRAGREHAYDDQPREQKSSYGSTDVHGCSLAYLSLLSPAIEVAYLCPYVLWVRLWQACCRRDIAGSPASPLPSCCPDPHVRDDGGSLSRRVLAHGAVA